MSDAIKDLGKILDESNMQVTVTGWKRELELCEKERDQLRAELERMTDDFNYSHEKYRDTQHELETARAEIERLEELWKYHQSQWIDVRSDNEKLTKLAQSLRAELITHDCAKWPSGCRICSKLAEADRILGVKNE